MPMDKFKKLIDEAATIPQITDICLTGLSESLLDPKLDERLEYCKEKVPDKPTTVFTNGTYLTPIRFERLKAAGLGCVSISLNASSAEGRKEIMDLDDWDDVVQNIDYAVHHDEGIAVRVTTVVNKDKMTSQQAYALVALWGHWRDGKGGHVEVVYEGNWGGDSRTVRSFLPNETCGRAIGQIYVTYDGISTACCFDPLGRMNFGNVFEKGIRGVYNTDEYVKFRVAHDENRADEYEICKNCTRI